MWSSLWISLDLSASSPCLFYMLTMQNHSYGTQFSTEISWNFLFHYFAFQLRPYVFVQQYERKGGVVLQLKLLEFSLLHVKYKHPWYIAFYVSRREALVSNKIYIFAVKCWQSNGKGICSDCPSTLIYKSNLYSHAFIQSVTKFIIYSWTCRTLVFVKRSHNFGIH